MKKYPLKVWYLNVDGEKMPFPSESYQLELKNWQYSEESMAGAPTITDTVKYPMCLDNSWTKNEFVEFRGEKYYMYAVPTSEKNNEDARYEHKVTFTSERYILENVFFFDVVTDDGEYLTKDKPSSNSTSFSFVGTLAELVERLNFSLKYSGLYDDNAETGFCIIIDDDVDETEAKEVKIEDAYFATAMQEIYNVFNVPYYWDGKRCRVGFYRNEIEKPFEYGKDKGLLSVEKANQDYRIINRITGVGSARNIPYFYPNDDANGIIELECENVVSPKDVYVDTGLVVKYLPLYLNEPLKLAKVEDFDFAISLTEVSPPAMEVYVSEPNDTIYNRKYTETTVWKYSELFFLPPGLEVTSSMNFSAEYADYNPVKNNGNFRPENATIESVTVKKYIKKIFGETEYKEMPSYVHSDEYGFFEIVTKVEVNVLAKYDNDFPEGKGNLAIDFYDIYDTHVKIIGSGGFRITNFTPGGYYIKHKGGEVRYSSSGVYFSELDKQPRMTTFYTWNVQRGEVHIDMDYDEPEKVATVKIKGIKTTSLSSSLMPSVYRNTDGKERFYNAVNGDDVDVNYKYAYTNDDGDGYTFSNPYSQGNKLEGKQDFEDIYPTINGVTNSEGKLIGEVAGVAYDDDDSDERVLESSDENNTASLLHPHFYIRLNKTDGEMGFNLFKCGIERGAMSLDFISGACAGCSFLVKVMDNPVQVGSRYEFRNPVQVDENGNIVAGDAKDKLGSNVIESQQDTKNNSVWIALEKDTDTFGIVMPNATNNYRPSVGDKFVITNILLPKAYIISAEKRLDKALVKYMSENNDEKFTFSIKFSRIYLQRHPELTSVITDDEGVEHDDRIRVNTKINVTYNGATYPLYVSSMSVKCDDNILQELSVELSETLTIAQSKSKEQMSSIMGSINDAITARSTGVTKREFQNLSSLVSTLESELNTKLSRMKEDMARECISFMSGLVSYGTSKIVGNLQFGDFVEGLIGKGGNIDYGGNAWLESLNLRSFLSVPELRYNFVAVTIGERWETQGYGTIDYVHEDTCTAWLHLEEDEMASIAVGDICRGIFTDMDNSHNVITSNSDECGFSTYANTFTSYFVISSIIRSEKGICSFIYELRNDSTPHPCRLMKFVQYGNMTDTTRQASRYSTTAGHYKSVILGGVSTWEVKPENIIRCDGWVDGINVVLKSGDVVTLKEYGEYQTGNVYFANAITQLDARTLEDLQKQLEQYTVEISNYTDVVTVDDAGNVIGGLYELDEEGKKHNYRIHSAIYVRRGEDYLTIAEPDADAGKGTYKVYTTCKGCTAIVENSTIYVTSIDNVKDGIAGTEDDTDFDYDKMREVSGLLVSVSVDCEGIGTKVVEFPVAVKHDNKPYITFDAYPDSLSVAWNTKNKSYIGLPQKAEISAWKGDESVDVTGISAPETSDFAPEGTEVSLAVENGKGVVQVTALPLSYSGVIEIPVTTSCIYSGVGYEKTTIIRLASRTDSNNYRMNPNVTQVTMDYGEDFSLVPDTSVLTCSVVCNSSEDGEYELTHTTMTERGISLRYSTVGADGIATEMTEFPADGVPVSSSMYRIDLCMTVPDGNGKNIEFYETIPVNHPDDIKYELDITDITVDRKPDGTYTTETISIGVKKSTSKLFVTLKTKTEMDSEGLLLQYRKSEAYLENIENPESVSVEQLIYNDQYGVVYLTDPNGRLVDSKRISVTGVGNGIERIEVSYQTSNDSDNPPSSGTWEDSSPAVTQENPFLWSKTVIYYTNGNPSSPQYALVGRMGERGIDGSSVEYIYRLTKDGNAPEAPISPNPINTNTKGEWTDDPQGVSREWPYEWVCEHTKENGEWQAYSNPSMWSVWSESAVNISVTGNYIKHIRPNGTYEVAVNVTQGVNKIKYNDASEPVKWLASTLAVGSELEEGMYWDFATSDDGYTFTYRIYCGDKDLYRDIPFYVQIGDEKNYFTISVRPEVEGGYLPVMRGLWDSGYTDSEGKAGYSFRRVGDIIERDVVVRKSGGINYYYMVKGRTDVLGVNTPVTTDPASDTDLWEQGSKYNLLISDCIIGDNAMIGGFYMSDSIQSSVKTFDDVDDEGNVTKKPIIVIDGREGEIRMFKGKAGMKIGLNSDNIPTLYGYDKDGNVIWSLGQSYVVNYDKSIDMEFVSFDVAAIVDTTNNYTQYGGTAVVRVTNNTNTTVILDSAGISVSMVNIFKEDKPYNTISLSVESVTLAVGESADVTFRGNIRQNYATGQTPLWPKGQTINARCYYMDIIKDETSAVIEDVMGIK